MSQMQGKGLSQSLQLTNTCKPPKRSHQATPADIEGQAQVGAVASLTAQSPVMLPRTQTLGRFCVRT